MLSRLLSEERFAVCVIDEATQATEPCALVAAMGGAADCVVLAGDPIQLPPTVVSRGGVEVRAHEHVHACTHAHMHAHTHARTHTHTPTHTHTHTHKLTNVHASTHEGAHAPMHTQSVTHNYTHMHGCVSCTYKCTCHALPRAGFLRITCSEPLYPNVIKYSQR